MYDVNKSCDFNLTFYWIHEWLKYTIQTQYVRNSLIDAYKITGRTFIAKDM